CTAAPLAAAGRNRRDRVLLTRIGDETNRRPSLRLRSRIARANIKLDVLVGEEAGIEIGSARAAASAAASAAACAGHVRPVLGPLIKRRATIDVGHDHDGPTD